MYMVMSRDQNAGRNHSVRIDNSTFERVEEFKYLGKSLTNQNSIFKEIKSRLRSGMVLLRAADFSPLHVTAPSTRTAEICCYTTEYFMQSVVNFRHFIIL